MTTSHIDQLARWYADAEQVTEDNLPNKGDVIIFPAHAFPGYIIETVPVAWPSHLVSPRERVRILDRAPIPKPAWHDAPAVIASHVDSAHRSTWTPDPIVPGMWTTDDDQRDATDLRDVTPLIEAKVTDGMVERASGALRELYGTHDNGDSAAEIITAALGLETA